MELGGAHVLVTGGASGLGEASARHLAEAGAVVSVLDRDAARGEAVASAIGGRFFALDVTDPAAGTVVEAAAAAQGPIRGLVNCAGIGTAGRIAGRDGPMPLEDFARVVEVNLIGTFNMLRLVGSHMSRQALVGEERGVIVNTASVAAFDGQLGQAAYAASKGGIASLALPAAREFARFGVRVNTIAPGVFVTPLLGELPDEVRDTIAASIPFPPRLGEPWEFAHTVRFVFENTYLNAEVIRLDGGVRLPPR